MNMRKWWKWIRELSLSALWGFSPIVFLILTVEYLEALGALILFGILVALIVGFGYSLRRVFINDEID